MTSDITLQDRTIIVTGASRGIGRAIAMACAASGARVVVASRKQEGVDAAAASIAADGGEALAVACHMGNPAQVDELFARAATMASRCSVERSGSRPRISRSMELTSGPRAHWR